MPGTAQQYRAFDALAEDPDVVSSMAIAALPICDFLGI